MSSWNPNKLHPIMEKLKVNPVALLPYKQVFNKKYGNIISAEKSKKLWIQNPSNWGGFREENKKYQGLKYQSRRVYAKNEWERKRAWVNREGIWEKDQKHEWFPFRLNKVAQKIELKKNTWSHQ